MSPDTSGQELQVGQVFEGKYRILRELGRGGFGMVYLAFQEGMDRHVALKVLRSNIHAHAPSAKDRFLREVKIISKLKHPNTVTIHDFGETYDGGLYMVLEFVEGETLKQILKREGAQDPLRAADFARQIARSLAEAHRHGVVHRDLKPANIMVTSLDGDRDFVKVLDFGVARLLDSSTDDLTSAGLGDGERELIGTPRYMSPEQVRGESLTGASDIYGLGLMLYELLAGEPAVQGDSTMGLITQQVSPDPLRLPHAHAFPPSLQDILRIATAKPVAERFQSAEQMADALEQCIFQMRRDRNLTGPGTGSGVVPMAGYQSQLAELQPGFDHRSGWQSATPSGQWNQQSGHHPFLETGPGFDINLPSYAESGASIQDFAFEEPAGDWGPGQSFALEEEMRRSHASLPAVQGPLPTSGYNEISLPPGDDDYQPTVERDALNPAHFIKRTQGAFERNQHPSAELPAVGGLPPVPSDSRPFQVKRPTGSFEEQRPPTVGLSADQIAAPRPSQVLDRRRPPPREESLGEFTANVLKACVFGALALVSTYIAFLIIGAVLAPKVGDTVRLIVAVATALVVPGFAFFTEISSRERFRVSESVTERIGKVLLHTTLFALTVIIVGSGSCASTVVHELQDEPNWFLAEPDAPGFAQFNKRVANSTAGVVADVTSGIGLYDKRKRAAELSAEAAKQAAGRTKALPQPTRKGMQQPKPVAPEDDAANLRDSKSPTGKYEEW